MDEANEIYEKFWKKTVEKDGKIDFSQIKKELADYYNLMIDIRGNNG